MSEEQTPGDVFKEYVKALIVEIAAETPGASMVPDSDRLQSQIDEVVSDIDGVDIHTLSQIDLNDLRDWISNLEEIDFDAVSEITNRVEAIESALSDINGATGYF